VKNCKTVAAEGGRAESSAPPPQLAQAIAIAVNSLGQFRLLNFQDMSMNQQITDLAKRVIT